MLNILKVFHFDSIGFVILLQRAIEISKYHLNEAIVIKEKEIVFNMKLNY